MRTLNRIKTGLSKLVPQKAQHIWNVYQDNRRRNEQAFAAYSLERERNKTVAKAKLKHLIRGIFGRHRNSGVDPEDQGDGGDGALGSSPLGSFAIAPTRKGAASHRQRHHSDVSGNATDRHLADAPSSLDRAHRDHDDKTIAGHSPHAKFAAVRQDNTALLAHR